MKRFAKLVLALIAGLYLTGCVGAISGHNYTKKDLVVIYKVVKDGVVTFMTPEQIKQAKLDKLNVVITDTYKVVRKNDVATK